MVSKCSATVLQPSPTLSSPCSPCSVLSQMQDHAVIPREIWKTRQEVKQYQVYSGHLDVMKTCHQQGIRKYRQAQQTFSGRGQMNILGVAGRLIS